MNRTEAYAALDDLYGQLPALERKGRCHDTCTVIDMSELERERIADTTGVAIPLPIYPLRQWFEDGRSPRCPALPRSTPAASMRCAHSSAASSAWSSPTPPSPTPAR